MDLESKEASSIALCSESAAPSRIPEHANESMMLLSRLMDDTSEDIRRVYDGLSLLEESFRT